MLKAPEECRSKRSSNPGILPFLAQSGGGEGNLTLGTVAGTTVFQCGSRCSRLRWAHRNICSGTGLNKIQPRACDTLSIWSSKRPYGEESISLWNSPSQGAASAIRTWPVAAGALQQAGLIRYRHGHITVLDPAGLEEVSCECFRRIAAQEAQLRA